MTMCPPLLPPAAPATAAALQIAQMEFDLIHTLCDRANAPTHHDGQKLTAAQRVSFLADTSRDFRVAMQALQ